MWFFDITKVINNPLKTAIGGVRVTFVTTSATLFEVIFDY
jgi:hypothetical protein